MIEQLLGRTRPFKNNEAVDCIYTTCALFQEHDRERMVVWIDRSQSCQNLSISEKLLITQRVNTINIPICQEYEVEYESSARLVINRATREQNHETQ